MSVVPTEQHIGEISPCRRKDQTHRLSIQESHAANIQNSLRPVAEFSFVDENTAGSYEPGQAFYL